VFTNPTVLEYYAEARVADATHKRPRPQVIPNDRSRLPRILFSHLHIVRTHKDVAAATPHTTPLA
jgi:hypothetical protein